MAGSFVVWNGKAGDKQSDPSEVARVSCERTQTSAQPGPMPVRMGQASPPDPEVVEKASRRRFTPEYKLKIVQEAEACSSGELGAMLRREGLYFSNLACWRRQVAEGQLAALTPQRRGRKARAVDPRVLELEGEIQRLRERLRRAEEIIEVQKKISEILGMSLKTANA